MKKISLIKLAIKEWECNELEAEQALINIAIVVGLRKPSPECIRWAKRITVTEQGDSPDAKSGGFLCHKCGNHNFKCTHCGTLNPRR